MFIFNPLTTISVCLSTVFKRLLCIPQTLDTGSQLSRAVVAGIVLGTVAPFIITAIICIVVFLYIYCKNKRDNRRINERLQEYRRERVRANNNVRETAEMTVSDACIY